MNLNGDQAYPKYHDLALSLMITVLDYKGCYNSPPLKEILVPRIKR